MASSGRPARRSWWQVLLDPVFGLFFLGKLLSSVGQWAHNVVAVILAYELSGSAFAVGLVTVAQFVPQLVLAPWSGAAADRGDRRAQLMVGRCISATGSAGLAVWTWAVGPEGLPGVAPVVASAALVGVGFAVGGPAMHAMLPSLVRRDELDIAVTLNLLPLPLARATGPLVGAVVATTLGVQTAFAVAALCSVSFALVLLRAPRTPPRDARARRPTRTVLRYVRRDVRTLVLLLGVAAIGVGTDPSTTLAPAISADLGHGTTLVGPFATAFGIGAGIGFLLIPVARRLSGLERYGTTGVGLLAVGVAGLLVGGTPAVVLGAFVVCGAGLTVALTGLSAALQLRAPEGLRGRIMGLWSLAFLGSRPFAGAFNGALADAVSLQAALDGVLLVLVAATWLCAASDRRSAPRARPPRG